jgi:SulP family sulfate permease
MKRMAEVTNVSLVNREFADEGGDESADPNAIATRSVPPGVEVYEIDGPFFFGAAESFKQTVGSMGRSPKVLIVRMRKVPVIDSTGINTLRDLARRYRKDGTLFIISGVHSQPVMALTNAGLYDEIGEANICGNIDDALNRARIYIGLPTEERPAFAQPDVARETPHGERRARPRI